MSNKNKLMKIAKSAMESIQCMVEALDCDYERLEELRSDRAMYTTPDEWAAENPADAEELHELEAASAATGNVCNDRDDAEQQIREDCLAVEVRSGWAMQGDPMVASEYCLLLTTGGPAVRIVGGLPDSEPSSARLEVQDWFTPWTEYKDAEEDILLSYARCFYFGE